MIYRVLFDVIHDRSFQMCSCFRLLHGYMGDGMAIEDFTLILFE